ncbi:MAG: hypothetical protein AB1505_03655 [Candidatus Latescibacterota bacterium]
MVWIFGVAGLALLVINVQLLLMFQKRAHELRLRQEAPRRRIRQHRQGMRDSTARIRSLVATRLEEMRLAIDHTKQQADAYARAIAGLEERPVASEATAAQPAEGEAAAAGESEPEQDPTAALKEKIQALRRQQEEIGGHLASMRREMEIVQRSMERIQSRMQRRLGQGEAAR